MNALTVVAVCALILSVIWYIAGSDNDRSVPRGEFWISLVFFFLLLFYYTGD
jgi:hypothetical protein